MSDDPRPRDSRVVEIKPTEDGGVDVRFEGRRAIYRDYFHTVGEPPVKVLCGYEPATWTEHLTDPADIELAYQRARDE